MTSASSPVDLIKSGPHWFYRIKPLPYKSDRFGRLRSVRDVVGKSIVKYRGWDFPVMPGPKDEQQSREYYGGTVNWRGCAEYWRMHLSGQFVYMSQLREHVDVGWSSDRDRAIQRHVGEHRFQSKPNGIVDFVNLVWTTTEFIEFAGRLLESGMKADHLDFTVRLAGIRGFLVVSSPEHRIPLLYQATDDAVEWHVTRPAAIALGDRRGIASHCAVRLLEQFGWTDASESVIADVQAELVHGS